MAKTYKGYVMKEEYRGYNIVGVESFTMYEIKNKTSGPVPSELRGFFTSRDIARKMIDHSLNSLKKGRGRVKIESVGNN